MKNLSFDPTPENLPKRNFFFYGFHGIKKSYFGFFDFTFFFIESELDGQTFLDIIKTVDSKKSFVRTLLEFLRPKTIQSLKYCIAGGLLNIADPIEIFSKSGTSHVVKVDDIVYLPSEDRTLFGVSEVVASYDAFCFLKADGSVQFTGREEDYRGIDGQTLANENGDILEVCATFHSFCLVKRNTVIFLGNPCFGGLYRSKRKKGKFYRSLFYSRGVVKCSVTGKWNNRFKIQYKTRRSKDGSHEVGCAKQCTGGHLPSFYD